MKNWDLGKSSNSLFFFFFALPRSLWDPSSLLLLVQWLSRLWLVAIPWTAARQASLSFTVFQSLHRLISIELVMPSNHLILCYPFSSCLPVFPNIWVVSIELALCIRWSKYWSFSSSISPSSEYSGLISFKIDWIDVLLVQLDPVVQLTLWPEGQKLTFSSTTIQKHQFFFMVQLSHPNMITGKTIALTIWTFVNKVISLPLNTV